MATFEVTWSFRDTPRGYQRVCFTVWALALIALGALIAWGPARPQLPGATVGTAALTLLTVASTVRIYWRSRTRAADTYVTLLEAFSIPLLVVAGPLVTTSVVVLTWLLHDIVNWHSAHPRRWYKVAFNVASRVLEVAAAAGVVALLAGRPESVATYAAVVAGSIVSILVSYALTLVWMGQLWPGRLTMRLSIADIGQQLLLLPPFAVIALALFTTHPALPLAMGSIVVAINYAATQASHRADLEEQVGRDSLTGLLNQGVFWERIDQYVARAARGTLAFSVAVVDIDDFKRVNDTHGHLVGDECLRAVAACIRATVRGGDEPYRYGGEEFAVLLLDADGEQAATAAERIRRELHELGPMPVTASIGVATYGLHGFDGRLLVLAADCALYEAKAMGKDQVRIAAPARTDSPVTP